MPELDVHTSSLRTAASGIRSAADQLSEKWSALLGTASGMGSPWGNDDIGMLIGTSYSAVQDAADESYTSAAKDLHGFAEGLITMAGRYDEGEEQATGAVESVQV
jgi:hypothetical protein